MSHKRASWSAAVVLLLGAAVCRAQPQGPCTLALDLFAAPGSQSNCTSGCNYPGGLNKVNQTAAGNSATNVMYSVAGVPDGNKDFLLYFKADHYLFYANATRDVSACVPVASSRRRLLANAAYVTGSTSPTVQYKVNDEAFATITAASGDAYKIQIPLISGRFVDGNNTITIRVSVTKLTASLNGSSNSQPANDEVVTSIITFWRQPAQASAEFAFNNMCNTTTMVLNATMITPVPQTVYANGSLLSPAKTLFTPMITVWGKKVLNIDGTVPSNAYDAATSLGMVNFANKYYIMSPTQTNRTLSLVVNDAQLFEGTYEMNVTTSLVSDNPYLVAGLIGLTQIQQIDNAAINNKWESMKRQEQTIQVGVQRTPTYLSAITSLTTGTVQTGQSIRLSWSFRGIGKATCTHAGIPYTPCTSPANIAANDVSSGATHDFTVTFTDVCGSSKVAKFSYSSAGVTAVSKVDNPASSPPLSPKGNSASPSVASSLVTMGMGAAAFAVMGLVL